MNQIVKTVALLTTIALHSEAYLACVVTAAEAFDGRDDVSSERRWSRLEQSPTHTSPL